MDSIRMLMRKEFVLFLAACLMLGWVCLDGILQMVQQWDREEYSHGYMIPLVALYIAWQKRTALESAAKSGSRALVSRWREAV